MSDQAPHQSPIAAANLRILATTDVHMHLSGWDARSDRSHNTFGMDRLATLIRQARTKAPGAVLLVDNGDALQGTATADVLADQGGAAHHPWPRVLSALDYDAVGLGNHDFDYGLPFLSDVFANVDIPVLCASLCGDDNLGIAPHCMVTRHLRCSDGQDRQLRIGLTSVLPKQTMNWNKRQLIGQVRIEDGVAAARRAVSDLKAAGADIVVMLCHDGLDADAVARSENMALPIAQRVTGVDAIIMGHTHRRFPAPDHGLAPLVDDTAGTVAGVPTVMPGFGAQVLGQIDLKLNWTGTDWQIADHAVHLEDVAGFVPDPEITALIAPSEQATRAHLSRPVGATAQGFHSYFAMLQSGTADALVAQAILETVEDQIANTELADAPLVAAVAPLAAGGMGGVDNYVDVTQGTVTERHIAMICPFRNAISVLELSGADLWAWAAHAAHVFAPPGTGNDALVATDAAMFNFDGLHGLDTVYDLDAPAGPDRVAALRFNGRSVAADDRFIVATTSYRAEGGGGFPGLSTADHALNINMDVSDALRALIRSRGVGAKPAPSVWRFASGAAKRRVIETSPRAERHLDDIAAFRPEVLGQTETGFLRIRVTL